MSDPRYEFLKFKDLQAAGIVKSRYDLHMKIRHHGFPKPLKDGAAMQAAAFWRKSSVHAWLDREYPETPAKTANPTADVAAGPRVLEGDLESRLKII